MDSDNKLYFVFFIVILSLLVVVVVVFISDRNDASEDTLVIDVPTITSTPIPTLPNESVALLAVIEGEPEVKFSGADMAVKVEDGLPLQQGDTIETDNESRAFLIFPDNTSLSIDQNSSVLLSQLQDSNGFSISVDHLKGRQWSRASESTNYLLDMGTAVTRSTGGSFMTKVVSDVKSVVSAVSGNTVVAPVVNGAELDPITVPEGKYLPVVTGEDSSSSKKIKSSDKDSWYQFNICLDSFVPGELVRHTDVTEKYKAVKDRIKVEGDCQGILGISTKRDQQDNTDEDSGSRGNFVGSAPKLSNLNADISDSGKFTCSWSSSGDDITQYKYAIGTAWGKTDIKGWTATSNKSVNAGTATSLGLVDKNTYYCTVKVNTIWGNAKQSAPALYDTATGSLSLVNPEGYFYTGVNGNGNFSNIAVSDLLLRFNLLNIQGNSPQNNKYCRDDNNWGSKKWFSLSLSSPSPGLFLFDDSSIDCVDQGNSERALFSIELKSTATGKVLYKQSFEVAL
ncbi:MAG: FecR domain-containing protein [Candidatus Dojkabacteria bacterium]